jgi:imidazolonepropionase
VRSRLDRLLALGATTVEVKSGYGLSRESEITSLRAITAAANGHPVRVVRTYLGAHEVPLDRRADREGYIEEMVEIAIPEIARLGQAEFADVFCERGVFTVDESRRILRSAADAGLALRIHADEFHDTGGASLAAELRARSADHLIQVSDEGIAAMARAGVVATLMPAASFFLKLGKFAPARKMIDAGVRHRPRLRHQSRRRSLGLDPLRHDPGLLRHGPFARRGAVGRHHRRGGERGPSGRSGQRRSRETRGPADPEQRPSARPRASG